MREDKNSSKIEPENKEVPREQMFSSLVVEREDEIFSVVERQAEKK